MTSDDGFDLESDWQLVRPQPQATPRPDIFQRTLAEAQQRALARISEKYQGKAATDGYLVDSVQIFMDEWFQCLRSQDRAGLVEAIIEGQNMSSSEIRGFVRALPMTFLVRVSEAALSGAKGIHALLSVECNRRTGVVRDYEIKRIGDRIRVDVFTGDQKTFHFFLDDDFQVDNTDTDDSANP